MGLRESGHFNRLERFCDAEGDVEVSTVAERLGNEHVRPLCPISSVFQTAQASQLMLSMNKPLIGSQEQSDRVASMPWSPFPLLILRKRSIPPC